MRSRLGLLALLATAASAAKLPVVIFHGLGDSVLEPGLQGLATNVSAMLGGVYVKLLYVGSPAEDSANSFLGAVVDQLAEVCKTQLVGDARLAGGYNGLGLSQGGPFLRHLLQSCEEAPPMHTLVSLGGPHGGVAKLPECGGKYSCLVAMSLVKAGVYTSTAQKRVVPAQYFRKADDEATFLAKSSFLPLANNLVARNAAYKARILGLDRLVLFSFAQDKVIVPRDSALFSMQSGSTVVPLREQALYTEDWLGLRTLNESGRLHVGQAPGGHLEFSLAWLAANVIKPFLSDEAKSATA